MTDKYILLAEDDDADAEMTIDVLKKHGYAENLVRVKDGEAALDFLNGEEGVAEDRSLLPTIVLLDINMPKKTGIDVLREIRQNDKFNQLVCVMLTSSQEDRDLIDSYNLNVNSYVIKPVDIESFEKSIQSLGIFWFDVNHPPKRETE